MSKPVLVRDPNGQLSSFKNSSGEAVQAVTDDSGVLKVNSNIASISVIADETEAQTEKELIAAPGEGKRIVIDTFIISNGATAGSVQLFEDDDVAVTGKLFMGANSGVAVNTDSITLSENVNLVFTSTSCTTHSIQILYSEESI
jgi:hypothetical protein